MNQLKRRFTRVLKILALVGALLVMVILLSQLSADAATPLVAPAGAATEVNCSQQIHAALQASPQHISLHADAAAPFAERVLDFGGGCRITTTLEFHASGGAAVAQQELRIPNTSRSGGSGPIYPTPASPATQAGVDPFCYQHSWQTDCCGIQTWAADIYQHWDNLTSYCCDPLVNPWADSRWVTDPFFVNTRNAVTDTWATFPTVVTAEAYVDFHSNAGPTNDGVHHWMTAQSNGCAGNAVFWGPNVPNGTYHSVGPNGPQ